MKTIGYVACRALAGVSALALVAPAHAQEGPAAGVPADAAEIIVTAQKRAENIQKVPISVTLISSDQLERRGVQGIQDLSQASASLEFTAPTASPGGAGFVRGIGTSGIDGATTTSSVSLVLDGVVLGKANITDLFDTDRIEVLKGPQGTLFGSSVSAGVINITTKAPKLGEVSGYVGGELALDGMGSAYTRKIIRGAINLPVTATSALRLAVQAYDNSGMSHDTYTGGREDLSSIAVRLRYRAELGDKVTFNLIGDYNQTRDNGFSLQTFRAATPGSPLAGALAACGLNVGPDNTSNCQGLPAFYHTAVGGVSGQFDVKLGSATLTSITSWRQREERTAVDVVEIAPAIARQYLSGCVLPANAQYACSPLTSLVAGSGDDPHSVRNTLITQELRLASAANHHLEWVAGLYFQRAVYAEALPLTVSINPALPAGVPDIVTVNSTAINAAHASDYAVFGNVTYFLRPDTRLIGGLRFTHSDVWETTSNAVNLGSSAFFTGTGKADVVTWRAGVQHDFTPATMAYFTAATGYKAPEIDDSKTTMPAIKPEEPLSLEMGIKQTVLHGKFYINADLFYTDVRNFQTQSCVYGLGGLTCSSVNVPHVHTHGLEWDIFGHPFTGTTVNISGIYNIAKYSHGFLGADRSDLGGFQLNYAPRFKMTVSLEQAIPLNRRYTLVLGGDATIRSSESMYLSSSPVFVVPGATLFNARASLKSATNWSLAVFGRNLANKVYPVQLYPTTAYAAGGVWQALDNNAQRQVGLQAEIRF